MKPDLKNPERDCVLSLARMFSHRTISGSPTGDVLSFAAEFRPVPLRGTSRAPVSLAPGFSRVAPGRGTEKTVLTVFLQP